MKKVAWTVAALAVMLAGCSTQRMGAQQLERVAKDWSLGIRASQVIPVYPLTEDLQPGDVFLVQTPVERQVDVYLDRGFLPLENLVARLSLEDTTRSMPAGRMSPTCRRHRGCGSFRRVAQLTLRVRRWQRSRPITSPSRAAAV